MNNSGNTLVKVAVLAGGAIVGALLSRWLDTLLHPAIEEPLDNDKLRYAQGLGPVVIEPIPDEPQG